MTALAYPGLASIRRLAAGAPGERCDVCRAPIDARRHRHLVELEHRNLQCVCVPCHLLLSVDGAGGGRWRGVPDRWQAVTVDAGTWGALGAPVGLAFLVVDEHGDARVAYPGPAGITEAAAPPEGWAERRQRDPALAGLRPEGEALLLRRSGDSVAAYIVPISACYELAGRLRAVWEGFGGGPAAATVLEAFFADLRARTGSAR